MPQQFRAAPLIKVLVSAMLVLSPMFMSTPMPVLSLPQALAADKPPSCLVLFSQGRNFAADQPAVNDSWNEFNLSFHQFVTTELGLAGKRIISEAHPVEATAATTNLQRVLKSAYASRCETLIEVSVFTDSKRQRVVWSFRAMPVISKPSEDSRGINVAIGEDTFARERAEPISSEALKRAVPREIAKELVQAYLAQEAKR